jgi:hypothetical protein
MRIGSGGFVKVRSLCIAAEAIAVRLVDREAQDSPGLERAYPKYGASGEGIRQRRIKGPVPKGRLGNSAGAAVE